MVETIWNWITAIPPAVWGSLIAGLMTLLGVIVGQYAIQRREEWKNEEDVEALRNALAVELRAYDQWLEKLLYAAHDLEKLREDAYGLTEEEYGDAFKSDLHARISMFHYSVDDRPISRPVYKSNADKLGGLDPQTAEMVVRTHGLISSLNQHLENMKDEIGHEELALKTDIDWSTGAGLPPAVMFEVVHVKEMVARTLIYQKITLSLLGETPSESDLADVAFAFVKLEPKSEKDAEIQEYLEQRMKKDDVSSFEELIIQETQ